jgi:hypothetical protein
VLEHVKNIGLGFRDTAGDRGTLDRRHLA